VKNPEKLKEKNRRHCAAHAEKRRAYATAYRAVHPAEARAAVNKAWREANAEKVKSDDKARKAAFKLAYPERVKALAKASADRHPETRREGSRRRRARVRGQFVETIDMRVLFERDGGRCGICGKKVEKAVASVDHILPISKGGLHSYANVRLAHQLCNYRRGNRGAAQLRLVG
jgi:hypothetical protein